MFKNIVPGEAAAAESAVRYNAVNHLLNSHALGTLPQRSSSSPESIVISGFNQSSSAIAAGTAVTVSGGWKSWERSAWDAVGFNIDTAKDDRSFWGVTTEEIPSGAYGGVVIHGVVRMKLAPGQIYYTAYVQPKDGKPVPARPPSRAQILKSDGIWAIIYLGSPAVGGSYNSYFKVMITENDIVRVVDGASYDPARRTSGDSICRVNNKSYRVPAKSFGTASGEKVFYLDYNSETDSVTLEDGGGLPDDDEKHCYCQIGRIAWNNEIGTWDAVQDSTGVPQMWWMFLCQ